jgi:multiple sugar transport system permease protein
MATQTDPDRERTAPTTRPVDAIDDWYRRLDDLGVVTAGAYLAVGVFLLWTLFPVYWMVTGMVKTRRELLAIPPNWLPTSPEFGNLAALFAERPEFVRFILNSVVVSVAATLLAVTFGVMATYGFVNFEFPYDLGSFELPLLILATRFLPPIVTIIPIYVIFEGVGLVNTHLALVLAYTVFNIPFVVWLMKGFFDELPDSIVEAAKLDGHTEVGAFFRVVLPMVKPGIVASAIFTLMGSWNELLFAVILTNNVQTQTLPVALATFQTQYFVEWELLTVAGTIAMAPVLLFAFLVREQLLRGFTMGAVE